MSVSNGQKGNQTVFNAAFVSRTTDTNTTGKLDLENVDAVSGSSVTNTQRAINGGASFTGFSTSGVYNQKPSWGSDSLSGAVANESVKDRIDAIQAVVETDTAGKVAKAGGTASSSNKMILYDNTTSGLDALTDEEGSFAYDSDQNAPVYNDGAGWIKLLSTSSGSSLQITSITSGTTLTVNNDVVLCDASSAAFTVEPPTAVGNAGKEFIIKKTDTDNTKAVTIDPNGSETIDGSSTTTINTQGESVRIISDGSNWVILNREIPSILNSYTPTGAFTTNTTYSGSWTRVGFSMEIEARVLFSGAPNTANATLTIPSGFTIDTSKLQSVSSGGMGMGTAIFKDVTGNSYGGQMTINSSSPTTTLDIFIGTGVLDNWSATFPVTIAASDFLTCQIKVPISGWNG